MSKIGRKLIKLSSAQVSMKDRFVIIKGPKGVVEHELPACISADVQDGLLKISVNGEDTRKTRMVWGLHRALISGKVQGVEQGFQTKLKIVGLGYKAQISGKKMVFTLGYSHKIDYKLPESVTVDIDKSGQNLTVSSIDKFLLGFVCDEIRSFRKPEPYKGTGIIREGDVVLRKAGKAKSATG
jgi:large subunit ribosomal protein L6